MALDYVSTDLVKQQLNWRYATKKFDPTRKISPEIWAILEESLRLAPSSFGLQPWQFIVVNNPAIRNQLVEHSWGQKQVVNASHLLVLALQKHISPQDVDRYLARTAAVQGTPIENLQGFGNVIKGFLTQPPYPLNLEEWAARQVYIALGQLMTVAAFLGIDTCPMEGFIPAKYDEILGLHETPYRSVVVCPVGYRSEDDKNAQRPKVRYAKSDVFRYVD
ncbi:nitroreductase [Gloeomargarita lithophora Alchichica-D10]|uniref:Nitroreductase n=1 Tax=Gloeomargarita lithophora Alchichica-D10 TaxID=1188229 RepID=A0A1J0AD25_9CYAN|nr:NAD(P)H-dependent oxidoreductase [Gloeomargarita lithophora]APB33846.1 nitroreductase [Gloeomargarita lithophora Alchichica-D10]